MHRIAEMFRTHPKAPETDDRLRIECVEACLDCLATCSACADACLHEHDLAKLRHCIALNVDCADVCGSTARVLSGIGGGVALERAQLAACLTVARLCAEECERHAGHHAHCRVCAEACRRCERACEQLLGAQQA